MGCETGGMWGVRCGGDVGSVVGGAGAPLPLPLLQFDEHRLRCGGRARRGALGRARGGGVDGGGVALRDGGDDGGGEGFELRDEGDRRPEPVEGEEGGEKRGRERGRRSLLVFESRAHRARASRTEWREETESDRQMSSRRRFTSSGSIESTSGDCSAMALSRLIAERVPPPRPPNVGLWSTIRASPFAVRASSATFASNSRT